MAEMTSSAGMALLDPIHDHFHRNQSVDGMECVPLHAGDFDKSAEPGHRPDLGYFFSASAKASAICAFVPPKRSTAATAAIAVAVPHSAWQPPTAPAIDAFSATTLPIAPASKKCSRHIIHGGIHFFRDRSQYRRQNAAGPAVGHATMRYILAFASAVATAYAAAR